MDSTRLDDPFRPDVLVRLRHALLLGLSRQPLAMPPAVTTLVEPAAIDPALALLALFAQRQRFAAVTPLGVDPVPEAARRLHEDTRPPLPAAARRALLRLTAATKTGLGSTLPVAALQRIAEVGFRLHPFDLPELATALAAKGTNAGLAERAYLALIGKDGGEESLRHDDISTANWTTFGKTRRRQFLIELRLKDRASARDLLMSVWKSEPAAVRTALLEALATGLGPEDDAFLQQLATDRSEAVRQLAASLSGQIGTDATFEERLTAAAGWFKIASSTLGAVLAAFGGGATAALVFSAPKGSEGTTLTERARVHERVFARLPLEVLAAKVGVGPDEILNALPNDADDVRMLFLETASAASDTVTSHRILANTILNAPAFPALHTLMQILGKVRTPLTADQAARVLASPQWASKLKTLATSTEPSLQKDDGTLALIATAMPHDQMAAFSATLGPLPTAVTRVARDFAELVLALNAPNAPTPTGAQA